MRWILLCSILVLFSCKDDKKTVTETPTKAVETTKTSTPVKKNSYTGSLPKLCDHINAAYISSLIGVSEDALTINNNKKSTDGASMACFYKWEDPNVANAGAMVQVLANPIPDEAPNFHEMFIQGKKANGEIDPITKETIKYKDFPGFGDDGAYSAELSKYLFRDGDNYSYMIAFNTDWSDEKKMKMAKVIAQQIIDEIGLSK